MADNSFISDKINQSQKTGGGGGYRFVTTGKRPKRKSPSEQNHTSEDPSPPTTQSLNTPPVQVQLSGHAILAQKTAHRSSSSPNHSPNQ